MKKFMPVILILLIALLFGCDNSSSDSSTSGGTGDNTVNVTGINVSPETIELDIAQNSSTKTAQINAYVIPANASNQKIGYDSSSPQIAGVDENGVVTAHAVGAANITVASLANVSIFKTVTVIVSNSDTGETPDINNVISIEVNSNNIELDLNALQNKRTFQIEAVAKPEEIDESLKTLIFSSNNTNVAEVDNTGLVSANSEGNAVITVKAASNPDAFAEINVKVSDTTSLDTPSEIVLNLSAVELDVNPAKNRDSFQIDAQVLPSELADNKKGVTYESNDANTADVSLEGLVTAKKAGTAVITVTSTENSAVKATLNVTVNDTTSDVIEVSDIQVDNNQLELDINSDILTYQLNPKVLPDNATNKYLMYSIDNDNIAKIDNLGNITIKNTGNATITITSQSNTLISKNINLVVKNSALDNGEEVPLQNIVINESNPLTIKIGEPYQIKTSLVPINTTQTQTYYHVNYGNFATVSETGLLTGLKADCDTKQPVQLEIYNIDYGTNIPKQYINLCIVDENGPIALNKLSVTPKEITVNKDSYLGYFTNHIAVNYEPANTTQKSLTFTSSSPLVSINNGIVRVADITGKAEIKVQSSENPDIYDTVTLNIIDPFDREPPVYEDINPGEMSSHTDRMYIKIKFDVSSSVGNLYDESERIGIRGIDFQNNLGSGTLIKEPANGYIAPYGYCEKYKCFADKDGLENTLIAKKNIGINYYVGANILYTPVQQSGTTNYSLYLVFFKSPGVAYTRPTVNLPIDWSKYDPKIHKNAAKFHITVKDKITTVTFDGFETK